MRNEQLVGIFLEESADLLEELEQGLVQLEERSHDRELVNGVFRAAHSIKGGAGAVGYDALVTVTHTAENVLSRVRERELEVTRPLIDLLLRAVDKVRALVDDLAAGTPGQVDAATKQLLANLGRYEGVSGGGGGAAEAAAPAPEPEPVEAHWAIKLAFAEDLMATGQDPLLLFEDLAEVGTIERSLVNMAKLPPLDELDPEQIYLSWELVVASDKPKDALDNVFLFVADDNDISISPLSESGQDYADLRIGDLLVAHGHVTREEVAEVLERQKPTGQLLVEEGKVPEAVVEQIASRQEQAREARRQAAIRVGTDKLDGLLNTVGEMVINIARSIELLRQGDEDAQSTADAIEGLSRELQEQAMGLRMVSIEPTFSRFKRTVRDLAGELGKDVKLDVIGGETELDKNVIESIADPLKHLIRNAVHHGLESPEAREAAGKPRTGTLRLAAEQREGSIFLEVGDDGGGINGAKVLAKAKKVGLVAEDAELSEAECHGLLFEAGFSTADEVNEISGRGVGLDVVRKNIEQLRGDVSVISKRGEGTTFRIRLPLTLAIVDGMTVRIGEEVLTVPLLSVIEQLRPDAKDLKTVEGSGELVGVRGEFVPLLRLNDVLCLPGGESDPSKGLVMIVEGGGRRFAVLVDEVLGQVQAVVKSLDRNFRTVPGISGATILGDGRVSLILDVHSIEKVAKRKAVGGSVWQESFAN